MMTDSFLDYLRFERNYSEKTIVSYGIDLIKFEEYIRGKDENVDFTTVDADLVRGWVMNLIEDGYTSASVNRKLSSLRSFYRFLLKKGVIGEDPMLKIIGPKNKKPLPVFLKEREMDRLLDDVPFKEDFTGCRDRMVLEMFYATGMRLSELIGLNDVDVDFSASLIKVTGKRNKQRLIPFGLSLIHIWVDENVNQWLMSNMQVSMQEIVKRDYKLSVSLSSLDSIYPVSYTHLGKGLYRQGCLGSY